MSYEKIIGDAILGKTSTETAGLKVGHLYAVQREIFCKCGNILDVRSAVYFENKKGEYVGIYCGKCWDNAIKKGTVSDELLEKLNIYNPNDKKRR